MSFRDFERRSLTLERLDKGDYTPGEYTKWLSEMRLINRFLGDNRCLKLELDDVLRRIDRTNISILDLGAGSGELLEFAGSVASDKRGLLVGAELNAEAAMAINKRSTISAVQCDALNLPFADGSFDLVISSLFLHHLKDEDAVRLISEMARVARTRFVLIDLRRDPAAYYLYKILGPLVFQSFTVEDGSLSIKRSFRPAELRSLALRAGVKEPVIKRRAAFRLVLTGRSDD